jgi:hypothetical protein
MALFRFAALNMGMIVTLGIASPGALGQPGHKVSSPKVETAPTRVERQVYMIHGEHPKELANALILHFKAEPALLAVPVPGTNSLLLSGPMSVVEEARAVLHEIDRPARAVHVKVLLVELTGKTGGDDAREVERMQWDGPVQEVETRIRDLQKRGSRASVQHIDRPGRGACPRAGQRKQALYSRRYDDWRQCHLLR